MWTAPRPSVELWVHRIIKPIHTLTAVGLRHLVVGPRMECRRIRVTRLRLSKIRRDRTHGISLESPERLAERADATPENTMFIHAVVWLYAGQRPMVLLPERN